MVFRQRVEHDDLVDAVQELGPEVPGAFRPLPLLHVLVVAAFMKTAILQNAMAADIGSHDHDRVLEIDRAALSIGQPAIIQNLKQEIENIRDAPSRFRRTGSREYGRRRTASVSWPPSS